MYRWMSYLVDGREICRVLDWVLLEISEMNPHRWQIPLARPRAVEFARSWKVRPVSKQTQCLGSYPATLRRPKSKMALPQGQNFRFRFAADPFWANRACSDAASPLRIYGDHRDLIPGQFLSKYKKIISILTGTTRGSYRRNSANRKLTLRVYYGSFPSPLGSCYTIVPSAASQDWALPDKRAELLQNPQSQDTTLYIC